MLTFYGTGAIDSIIATFCANGILSRYVGSSSFSDNNSTLLLLRAGGKAARTSYVFINSARVV